MRFDMWKSKAQKGAFLVFTALMIPIIFICAGFAVDLGNAWAYKSKLQNAADAAVLAGAYQYQADSNDKKEIEDRIDKYMNANNGGIPFSRDKKDDSKNGIFYRFPKDGDTQKGLLLTLHVSEEAPTAFSKMFGLGSLHVAVVSTARILTRTISDNAGDDVFSYAFIGAGSKKDNQRRHYKDNVLWKRNDSIHFNSYGLVVNGKIYANDSVRINGPNLAKITNANDFSTSNANDFRTSQDDDSCLWSDGNNQGEYRLVTTDGTPIHANEHYVSKDDAPNIDLGEDNPKTKNIYKYINDSLAQYGKYGPNGSYGNVSGGSDLDHANGIYICLDPHSYLSNFGDWRAYKVIITYGDVHIIDKTFSKYTSNDHLTVISLKGNITIDGYNQNLGTIKGLFYAPNGEVNFNTNVEFEGSMVGQQIFIQNNYHTMKWNRFDFPGGSSDAGHGSGSGTGTTGGSGEISLHADIDDSYEPAS